MQKKTTAHNRRSTAESSEAEARRSSRAARNKAVPTDSGLNGLTEAEARQTAEAGYANIIPDSSAKSVKDIVRENVVTYFNGIFLLLAILLMIAGSWNSLTFLPVIILNTVIGIIQEIHAKHILDNLSVLNQARSTVVREAKEYQLPVSELVQGDVIRLKSGDQIPADGSVIKGTLAVNESLLTGEADEIEKTPSGDRQLKSGSFVVSGDACCRLEQVGANSYISKLTEQAKQMNGEEESEMIRSINLLIRIAGILIIPIGITLFVQNFFIQGGGFSSSVVSMVAAVIGMIPEGLYLLVTVALALSAVRLAQKQVVLHDMRSIESLARVDTLCVDKTGTITSGDMTVTDCVLPKANEKFIAVEADTDAHGDVEDAILIAGQKTAATNGQGSKGQSQAAVQVGQSADNPQEVNRVKRLIGAYIACLSDDNITMKAMREYFTEKAVLHVRQAVPFSSKNKYSEVYTEKADYRLGAPEMVLGETTVGQYSQQISSYAQQGLRVMVFAARRRSDEMQGAFIPLAFIVLRNGVRPHVEDTFRYLEKQGVTIRVISGDNPQTVSRIAMSVGIENADRYVDASTLKTEEDIANACSQYTVFGRVKPEQKKQIVMALQAQGHKVAMTGDGVNDILAMKEADCSIAMGSGSDAAVQAAQVALLDDDFSKMKNIIYEGRNDINNIARSATLFLVKNIFSLLLAIFSIINVLEYPLQPTQISLISMFNIGIPAFFLALEPNTKRQEDHFLRNVLITALPAALTDFFAIAALVIFGMVFKIGAEDVSVAATFLLAIVGFMILIRISAPMNWFHVLVVLGCIAGLIVTAFFMSDLFAVHYISTKAVMLFVLFAIATEPCMRYLTMLFDKIEEGIHHLDRRKEAKRRAQ